MYRKVCFCDLCGDGISEPDENGALWGAGSQVWPVGEIDEYDVCEGCVPILFRARELKIIEFDLTSVFTRAGYVRHKGAWVREHGKLGKEE